MNKNEDEYRIQLLLNDKEFNELAAGEDFALVTLTFSGFSGFTLQTIIVYEKNKKHETNADETYTMILTDDQFSKLLIGEEISVGEIDIAGQKIAITLKRKNQRDKLIEAEVQQEIEIAEEELLNKTIK